MQTTAITMRAIHALSPGSSLAKYSAAAPTMNTTSAQMSVPKASYGHGVLHG